MSDPAPLPGPTDGPWAAYGPVITGQIRLLLTIAGAAGFTWAQAVTADQIAMWVSAIMVAGPMVWSAYQNWKSRRNAKEASAQSAVASARETAASGVPTAVVVAPKTST